MSECRLLSRQPKRHPTDERLEPSRDLTKVFPPSMAHRHGGPRGQRERTESTPLRTFNIHHNKHSYSHQRVDKQIDETAVTWPGLAMVDRPSSGLPGDTDAE